MVTQTNGDNLMVQGRLVWTLGNLCEGKQKTVYLTNTPILGKDGNPVIEYGFGLAIPKIDPKTGQSSEEFTKLWNALHQEAFTLYPDGVIPPDFAMKYKDGDTAIDKNGKPYRDREGYAGHLILSCTTQISIKYFIFQGGNNVLVNEGIKCGDYVNVQLNIKAHPAPNAGLYVNPSCVQLIQPGKEIINTPSGDQIFGQDVPAYAGQVEAPTQAPMPGQVAAPMPGQAPVLPPATTQPPLPPAAPAPNYDVIPQNHQPAPAPAAPAMPGQPMGNVVTAPVGPGTTMPSTLPPVGNVVTPGQGTVPNMPGQVGPVNPVPPSNGVPVVPGMPPVR